MTEHEYKFISATWAGTVTSVNGARPETRKLLWQLVNSLGAAGWRLMHVTPIGRGTTKADTMWVILHRESHGPESL